MCPLAGAQVRTALSLLLRQTTLVVEWITSDDGKLKTALSATSVLRFYVPWLASKAQADTDINNGVIGFAQRDIPNGKYFAALTDGQGLGKQPATGIAMLANAPLKLSSATDGTLVAILSADNTVAGI